MTTVFVASFLATSRELRVFTSAAAAEQWRGRRLPSSAGLISSQSGGRRPMPNYARQLEDVARKYDVEQDELDDFHYRRGGTFERIERELEWRRAYLPPDEQ